MSLSLVEAVQEREREEYREYMQSQQQHTVTLGDMFGDQLREAARGEASDDTAAAEDQKGEQTPAEAEPVAEAPVAAEPVPDPEPEPEPQPEPTAQEETAVPDKPQETAPEVDQGWRPAELPEPPEDD